MPNQSNRLTTLCLVAAFALATLFNGPGNNLWLLVPIIAVVLIASARHLKRLFSATGLVLPAGFISLLGVGYLVYLFASPFWSSWPESSLFYAWMLGLLPLGLLLWLSLPDTEAAWPTLRRGWWLAGTLVITWGTVEYLVTANRVRGPFLDFNAYGAFINVLFFPAFMRYVGEHRQAPLTPRRQGIYLGFFSLCLFTLFATYSRGAVGAWLVMFVAALGLIAWLGKPNWKPVITVMGIALASYAAVKFYPETIITRTIVDLAHDDSTHHRLMIWQSTWAIIQDHPWLGTGLGTYKLFYAAYRNPAETGSSGDMAHNDYLQFLQEGGPILLAFLLAFGLTNAWLIIKLLRLRGQRLSAELMETAGLLLAISALFIHAMVNFIFYVLPLSIVTGIYLAQAYRQLEGSHLPSPQPARRTRTLKLKASSGFVGLGLAMLVMIPTLGLALDATAALIFMKQDKGMVFDSVRDNAESSHGVALALSMLRPQNTVTLRVLADMRADQALTTTDPLRGITSANLAAADYLKILEINPVHSASYLGLGKLAIDYPHVTLKFPPGLPVEPRPLFELAIAHNRPSPDAYLELMKYLDKAGKTAEAAATGRSALPWFGVYVPDEKNRVEIIRYGMLLLERLGEHKEAVSWAQQLIKYAPDDADAKRILDKS